MPPERHLERAGHEASRRERFGKTLDVKPASVLTTDEHSGDRHPAESAHSPTRGLPLTPRRTAFAGIEQQRALSRGLVVVERDPGCQGTPDERKCATVPKIGGAWG